jgi:hypothetical protein
MKKLSLTFLSFAFAVCCFASENTDTLTVTDNTTKTGIGFATIYVKNKPDCSTIANINGKFRLKDIADNDSIIISSVGYNTLHTICNRKEYSLTPSNFVLREVVITNDNFRKYLKEIWNQISTNAPQPYPILDGIYRQQIAINDNLAVAAECDMKVKEPDFQESLRKNAKVCISDKRAYMRPELDFVKKFTFAMIPAGYPGIGEINPNSFNKFTYSIDKSYKDEQGNTITKIDFVKKDKTSNGYIYVNETNNAIIRFYFRRKIKNDNVIGNKLSVKDIYYTWNTTYQSYKDKYVHSYSRLDFEYDICDKETEKLKYKLNAVVDYKTNYILENVTDLGKNATYMDSKISPFVCIDKIKTSDKNVLKGIVTDYK